MPTAQRTNVVALPGVELAGLEVAATSYPGNPVDGSRNEIWLCPGYDSRAEPVMLYVKVGLATRSLMAEALCALLAQCLGLHAPRPYLVTVRPSHVGRTGQHALLAFGSLDVAEQSLARPLRDLQRLLEILKARKVADLAAVFDEWIGNDVRSPSDILVSPYSDIYLIDHEAAFPPSLRPDQPATNWLADRLLANLSGPERAAFLSNLRKRMAALHRINLGDAPGVAQFAADGVQTYRLLLQFLRDRLTHLDRLISERVIPAQRYLTPADETSDTR